MKRAAVAVTIALSLAPASVVAAPVHVMSGASTYTASSARAPSVTNQTPLPGSRVRTFYPQFSANIEIHGRAPLNRASVHLFVDGMDVTGAALVTQNTVTYLPHARVSSGWHDVFLEGADSAGQKFSDAWVFQLQPPDVGIEPVTSGFGFFPAGSPDFGGFVHFFLIAPTDGFAALQLCGIPQVAFVHVPLSPVFFVTVPVGFNNSFSPFFGCNVGAFFSPFNGFNQFNTVFLPLPFGIAGPNVQPNIPLPQSAQARRMLPVYRRADIPVTGLPSTPQTVITAPRGFMPIYRAAPNSAPMPPNALPMAPYGLPMAPNAVPMQPGTHATVPLPVAGTRAILPVMRAAPPPPPVRVPAPPAPAAIPH